MFYDFYLLHKTDNLLLSNKFKFCEFAHSIKFVEIFMHNEMKKVIDPSMIL